MNQLHGRVDINFGVKGTRGRALMRFKSVRRERMGKVSPMVSLVAYTGEMLEWVIVLIRL